VHAVDLAEPASPAPLGVVVAFGDPDGPAAEYWLRTATFTFVEGPCADRRTVSVDSIPAALQQIEERAARWPQAAAVCDDVLRSLDIDGPAWPGLVTESLAYSTLQSGPEFARWLAERGPATVPLLPEPVIVERSDDALLVRFNRPTRHNAFSTDARAALLDALEIPWLDPSVRGLVLGGNGPSFCSGGDLAEFGSFDDPASAHLARTRHSPALALDALAVKFGDACRAEVHGQVLGSGLEMAAFCRHVTCRADATLGLPELALGLIPGAGGTVSITRRIGRWRTAYLVLSGQTIDPATALEWGLVDALSERFVEFNQR
jgi:enoyl-CoA hydratase/carnithine racemase